MEGIMAWAEYNIKGEESNAEKRMRDEKDGSIEIWNMREKETLEPSACMRKSNIQAPSKTICVFHPYLIQGVSEFCKKSSICISLPS